MIWFKASWYGADVEEKQVSINLYAPRHAVRIRELLCGAARRRRCSSSGLRAASRYRALYFGTPCIIQIEDANYNTGT